MFRGVKVRNWHKTTKRKPQQNERRQVKRFFKTTVAALCVAAGMAAGTTAAPRPQSDKGPAEKRYEAAEGRDPVRGSLIGYATAEEAQAGSRAASAYLQPLDSLWSVSRGEQRVVYSARYKMPFAWSDRTAILHIGHADSAYEVYVNNKYVGRNMSGSAPGEFDLTPFSREGSNLLRVEVLTNSPARELESGRDDPSLRLRGEAYVQSQPRMRVRDVAVDARCEQGQGLFNLGVVMKTHLLNPKTYTVYYELTAPDGSKVAEGHRDISLDMKREDTVRFFANLASVRPWSHENPALYTLKIKTQHEGRFREYLSLPVGFRTASYSEGDKLELNGRKLDLTGREYSAASRGEALRRELEELKRQGVNLIKVTLPQPRELFDWCDRLGIYVCVQADIDTSRGGSSIAKGGNVSNDPAWEELFTDRVLSAYHATKRHPSVVGFSLSGDSPNGYNFYESFRAYKALGDTRPLVFYHAGDDWNNDAVALLADDYRPSSLPWLSIEGGRTTNRLVVRNNYRHTPFAGEVVYRVKSGMKTVASGTLPLRVAPGEQVEVEIPLTGLKPGKSCRISGEITVPTLATEYVPAPETPEPADGKLAAAVRGLLTSKAKAEAAERRASATARSAETAPAAEPVVIATFEEREVRAK